MLNYYHDWYGAGILKPAGEKMKFEFCDSSGYMQEYLFTTKSLAKKHLKENGWKVDNV